MGKPKFLCFYCRRGHVEALPSICPNCGCYLSAKVVPKMEINELAELAFKNGLRLNLKAVPIKKKGK